MVKNLLIFCFFYLFAANVMAQSFTTDAGRANSFYKEGKYAQALYIYSNISKEGNQSYDKNIQEIKKKLMNEALSNEQFQSCIIDGNAAYKNKEYEDAYICFQAALAITPDANFPKSRLKELARYITDPNIEKEFLQLKTQADTYFEEKNYELAETFYDKALLLKPDDGLALGQKSKLQQIALAQNKNREQYNNLIFKADRAMQNNNYNEAEDYYKQAIALFPKELYPQAKIRDIQNITNKNKEIDDNYNTYISKGDIAFKSNNYEEAKVFFSEANALKPEESYPQSKLLAINEIINKKNAKENTLNEIFDNINSYIDAKQYNMAMAQIQNGLRIDPTSSLLKEKKMQVESYISQTSIDNANYNNFIIFADELFEKKQYEESKRYYSRAYEIKASEQINAKIEKCNSLIENENINIENKNINIENKNTTVSDAGKTKVNYSEKKVDNDAAVRRADTKFNRKDYLGARAEYLDALKINSDNIYIRNRLAEIDSILSLQAKQQIELYEKEHKAYQEYNRNISTKPLNLPQIIQEGVAYYYKKDYDKAYNLFNKVIKDDPYNNVAVAYKDTITALFGNNIARKILDNITFMADFQNIVFTFQKLSFPERQNTYLAVVLSTKNEHSPKVIFNYFEDNKKKGGFVIKEIGENQNNESIYYKLSDIISWKSDDINSVEFHVEHGDVYISKVYIIAI